MKPENRGQARYHAEKMEGLNFFQYLQSKDDPQVHRLRRCFEFQVP
jgi:hypothetical protein